MMTITITVTTNGEVLLEKRDSLAIIENAFPCQTDEPAYYGRPLQTAPSLVEIEQTGSNPNITLHAATECFLVCD